MWRDRENLRSLAFANGNTLVKPFLSHFIKPCTNSRVEMHVLISLMYLRNLETFPKLFLFLLYHFHRHVSHCLILIRILLLWKTESWRVLQTPRLGLLSYLDWRICLILTRPSRINIRRVVLYLCFVHWSWMPLVNSHIALSHSVVILSPILWLDLIPSEDL